MKIDCGRARLENLMQSAKTYKTKACGVIRNPVASASGLDNTRVIIERKTVLSPRDYMSRVATN